MTPVDPLLRRPKPIPVVLEHPVETAFKATIGVVLGLLAVLVVCLWVIQITHSTIDAADVRAVCAAHGGVGSIYQDDGVAAPSRLVLCKDGYVGEPRHG